MKKLLLALCIFTISTTTLFASDSLSHFSTNDGRHMCAIFPGDNFLPCADFGVIYESGIVVSGAKPIFDGDGIVKVNNEVFCVYESREMPISTCDKSYFSVTSTGASYECIIKNGVEECHPPKRTRKELPFNVSNFTGSANTSHSSPCTINGNQVDCDKVVENIGIFAKAGLWVLLAIGLFLVIAGIFWLTMFIHALSYPIPNKILWVAVIFFLSLLGAIVYYFVVKRKFKTILMPITDEFGNQKREG